MQVGTTIKQITNFLSENALEEPREISELQIELKNIKTSVKAMKTIVSMIQQGYDMSGMYSDVLKVIDTNNYELKILCSFYLKYISVNKPACQLICTQFLLKDFNEYNPKIQKLAVLDSVFLSDEILLKNYIENIRRMCKHSDSDVRFATTVSLANFYLKNTKLFKDEDMFSYLKELVKDKDISVRIGALNAFASIERYENALTHIELFKMAKNFYNKGQNRALRATLNVLKYKRLTDQSREFYITLLNTNDICIFYLAASKLLENDIAIQEIYESSICFLGERQEQQYNILTFILSFLEKFKIDPTDFVVFNSDPLYIKKLKLKILFKHISLENSGNLIEEEFTSLIMKKNHEKNSSCNVKNSCDKKNNHEVLETNINEESSSSNKHSIISESNSENNISDIGSSDQNLALTIIKKEFESTAELTKFIIYNAIYYNVFIDGILNNFSTESILSEVIKIDENKVNYKWKENISKFLSKIKQIDNPDVFLTLIFKYSLKIPKIIFKYEDLLNKRRLTQFYVEMRDKGAISEHQCYSYVKGLSKKYPMDGFCRIVLENLSTITSDNICPKYIANENEESENVNFPIYKNYDECVISEISNLGNIEKLEQMRNDKECISNFQGIKNLNEEMKSVECNGEVIIDAISNIEEYNKNIGKNKQDEYPFNSEVYKPFSDINCNNMPEKIQPNTILIDDEAYKNNHENLKGNKENKNLNSLYLENFTGQFEDIVFPQNNKSSLQSPTVCDRNYCKINDEVENMDLEDSDKQLSDSIDSYVPNNAMNNLDLNQTNSSELKAMSFPIFIDIPSLKGTITHENHKIVLTVDILEKSQQMNCKIGSVLVKNMIRSEGKFTISSVPKSGNILYLKIGDFEFEGKLQ